MTAIRTQMWQLNETMQSLTSRRGACENRIDGLAERVAVLEVRGGGGEGSDTGSLQSTINQLRAELNDRDPDLLSNDLEISCVPKEKGESVTHIVMTLAGKLGVRLVEQELVSATRVGRAPGEETPVGEKPRPRPIVVRLAWRALRDQLLREARVRRGATTEGAGLPGAPRRFYVNERLTRANRQLFRQARQLGKERNWRYVWTRDGGIFARQHHGRESPRHRVRIEDDLTRVFGSGTFGA
ncbi:uncharacterized protein LOC113231916 [Hyposmocoma kahamanoa]|uniref:uncharacterized protein LOC113231916 n=1 Tax=Hyposmocoma kahamanoa TaxID=1477025 RepID=UPI000E6DA1D3|nr:uncharacterized protein LOC113231916 [Hyposmocoma kahamanoa]